jgi:glyceraldehyde-3-phosphate dehydrogenase/erythrose-4-phosphate dehydrogenase
VTVRIGVNGFGRIGRSFLRAVLARGADVEVVAVNDLTDAATLAHLLKYDSTMGVLDREVSASGDTIMVDGRKIIVLATKAELVAAIDKWIDRYNNQRRHSAIGMLNPVRYERSLTGAAKAA